MKKLAWALVFVLVAAGAIAAYVYWPRGPQLQKPEWAYGVSTEKNRPVKDDGRIYTLPGSTGAFTLTEIRGRDKRPGHQGPADWYPSDHPPMPKIVAVGAAGARNIGPCSLCHYPNGKGRSENAGVSGLPKDYIVRQLHDMAAGRRRSAEPLKGNAKVMYGYAKALTEDEINAAADYFSSIPWTPWIKVVESDSAPKVRSNGGLYLPLTGAAAGTDPLGHRIVEVPVDPVGTDELRNSRSPFIAYVPVGSVAKGRDIVTSGKSGQFPPCGTCHGADLNGNGTFPGIAARSPSYICRQLNDFKQGTRDGEMAVLMKPIATKLSEDDMLNVCAYLASRAAPAPAPGPTLASR